MASSSPLYAQLEAALLARFGVDLLIGDRLPTEDDLIEEYGVSRITVRRAIQNLAARKLIVTKRGVGSFVSTPNFNQPLTALTGFVEDMEAQGLHSTARVQMVREISAPVHVREALELPLGAHVVCVERVRLAAGHPISFDQTYLPLQLGRLVAKSDLENEPIFTLLETLHNTPLIEASYALQAITADDAVAAALEITEGDAIMRVERTSFTTGRKPVDYEILHYRGDAMTFSMHLPRTRAAEDNS